MVYASNYTSHIVPSRHTIYPRLYHPCDRYFLHFQNQYPLHINLMYLQYCLKQQRNILSYLLKHTFGNPFVCKYGQLCVMQFPFIYSVSYPVYQVYRLPELIISSLVDDMKLPLFAFHHAFPP